MARPIIGSRDSEILTGTLGSDLILGLGGDDVVIGNGGNDRVITRSGNDTIELGDGNARVYSGSGDDLIQVGDGNNRINGGRGDDTVAYTGSIDDYEISSTSRFFLNKVTVAKIGEEATNTDVLRRVEALYFEGDDFTFFLDGRNNVVLARDDEAETSENGVLNIAAADLLANDRELDGDAFEITGVSGTSAAGAVIAFEDGVVTYDPGMLFEALAEGDMTTDTFTYQVDDGSGNPQTATVTVTITGENDAPSLSVNGAVSIDENTTDVPAGITAADIDGGTIGFAIEGDDAARFTIGATGALSFVAAPDFENPADADGDNVYDITIVASDGQGGETREDIAITVEDVIETAPLDVKINELAVSTSGTDWEFAELIGAPGTSLDGVALLQLDGDGEIRSILDFSGLTVGDNGFLLAASEQAQETFGLTPDLSFANNTFTNTSSTFLLVQDFAGASRFDDLDTDDDGTIDQMPFGAVIDSVAVIDDDNPLVYSDNVVGPDGSFLAPGAERDPEGTGPFSPTDFGDPSTYSPTAAEFTPTPVINEIAVSTTGTDFEFVELFGEAGLSLDGYALLQVDGDGEIRSILDFNGLALGDNGFSLATSAQAEETFGITGDLSFANNTFTNTSSTFLLVSDFTGAARFDDLDTDDDGTLDVTPFGQIVDSVSIIDDDNPITYSENIIGPDGSFLAPGAVRNPEGSGPFEITSFSDASSYTPTTAETNTLVLNEIAVSTGGTDWEFAELFGTAGQSLDGVALLQIDGDGEIRSITDFTGLSIGDNGFALAASDQAQATFGVTPDLAISNNTFTNTSSTFLLVDGFTGASQFDDLDADDDGVIDFMPFGSVIDSVAIIENDNPIVYSDVVIGPDGTFLAPGAARNPDGTGEFQITSFGDPSGYSPTAGGGTTGGGDPDPVLISEIQGEGDESALVGQQVRVEGVVTFVVSNGFYLQEEASDSDGNAGTSEGIFVFINSAPTVVQGDVVQVDGTVDEFFGATQIDTVTSITQTGTDGFGLIDVAEIALSPDIEQDFEAVEGMYFSLTSGTGEAITVIENFNLDRFGEISVSAGNQVQPTQLFDAQTEADAVAALAQQNLNNRLAIDDGVSSQNPEGFEYVPANQGDNGNGFLDSGDTFSIEGPTLRLGAEIVGETTGVMSFSFGEYKMLVDGVLNVDETTNSGAREDTPPEVGGDIQIASFNVLNYFTTFTGQGGSGPNGLNPRGADNQTEFDLQTSKLVQAALVSGADVFGLQEIENGGFEDGSAIDAFVDALNAAATDGQVFAFANPTVGEADGFIGTDAITTGIIYDTTKVTLTHTEFLVFEEVSAEATFQTASALNAFVPDPGDQVGDFQRNRPAVAATFEDNESGVEFTIVSNHFKSKGDSNLQDTFDSASSNGAPQALLDALLADPNYDQGDGQGFWNQVRADAAGELKTWIETEYNGGGVSDYIILGDLNAYSKEDPVQVLTDPADTVDLLDQFVGTDDAYSFVFDGQRGALDHAIASEGLAASVTGLTEWHINADEPDLLGYNGFRNSGTQTDPSLFAASDHDPLIIGLDTNPADDLLV